MNLTIVIVSKRTMELALLLVAVCGLAVATTTRATEPAPGDELPARTKAILDESMKLDGQLLGEITRELGEDIESTLGSELSQLLDELSQQPGKRNQRDSSHTPTKAAAKLDAAQLRRLEESNKLIGGDIRRRIELVGDDSGKLPQMNLGATASSLLEAANSRIASASSFVGNKMRSLSSSVADRIPPRLKRFFRWPNFLQFKMRFHKRYTSLRTELYAQFVFLKNQIVVAMSNMRFITRRISYVLGQTQYSDMTEQEYRQTVANKADDELAEFKALDNQAEVLAKLRSLEAAKRTVHDSEGRARSRRSVVQMDYSAEDEMDEDEDEDETPPSVAVGHTGDEGAFGAGLEPSDMDVDVDPAAIYALLDEYASGAELDAVDEISQDIEGAIQPNSKFEPVDLRDTGCIGRPENQENCGMCYAHAATMLATYHNCMERPASARRTARLHARFVADCGRYYGPFDRPPFLKGCSGGRMTKAVEFIKNVGAPMFHDYNYAQVSAGILRDNRDDCAFPKPADITDRSQWPIELRRTAFFSKMRLAVLDLSDVHLHLKTVGPVLVNVGLWAKFGKYEGGVWDELGPRSGDRHSMLIVGHEYDRQGREVYVIWNTHGTPWGEGGYLRITAEALDHYKMILVGTMPDTVD